MKFPKNARRLRLVRIAAGYGGYKNQKKFAKLLGVSPNQYNLQERGQRDLSKDVAFKIVEKFPGCSLDWLWLGDDRGLTVGFAQRLAAAEKAVNTPVGPTDPKVKMREYMRARHARLKATEK
jgi:DNA-binding XRE family transcriptional regulator